MIGFRSNVVLPNEYDKLIVRVKDGDIYSTASHQPVDNVALNPHSTDSSYHRNAVHWTAERYSFYNLQRY